MSHDDTAEHLVGGLPSYYPSSEESPNYDLLSPIAGEFDYNEEDIDEVNRSITIKTVGTTDYTLPMGETATIPEGKTWVFREVTINGELIIEGTLLAESVDSANGTITNHGTLDTDDGYRDEIVSRLQALAQPITLPPQEGESVEHYRARIVAEFALTTGRGTIETLINTTAEILSISPERVEFAEPHAGERGTAELGLPSSVLADYELSQTELIEILDKLIPAGYRLGGILTGQFTYITPEDYEISNFDPEQAYDGLDSSGDPKGNGGTYAGVIQ